MPVETGRKPKTGLKRAEEHGLLERINCRDREKTQDGIETFDTAKDDNGRGWVETGRKPKTGLKPAHEIDDEQLTQTSRQGENPRRD